MKSVIISDLHNRVDWVDEFVNQTEYDELIFLGDYFDSWKDNAWNASKTALWLKHALDNYRSTIWLLGNHDMPYRFPSNYHLCCPGWTHPKSRIVNETLKQEDWKKFRLFYYTQGFLLSHAGVLKDIFEHPVKGLTTDIIAERCNEALEKAACGLPSAVLSAGRDRGGSVSLPGGGITWCDWNSFEPIPGLNQIVGHTIDDFVRTNYHPESQNYCLDTNNRDIGIIEDGRFSHITNPVFQDHFLTKRLPELIV